MNDQVSISIPPKTEYLKAAAAMLTAMAEANIADLPGVVTMKAAGGIAAGDAVAPAAADTSALPAAGAQAPPPPTTDTAAGVELDKDGIPWDSRIHGKAQKKNQDGTWRLIKGADKDLVASVKAELLAAASVAPGADAAECSRTGAQAPPAPDTTAITFNDLISNVTKYTAKGLLSPEIVKQILLPHGLTSIAELLKKPELVAIIASEIDTICQ